MSLEQYFVEIKYIVSTIRKMFLFYFATLGETVLFEKNHKHEASIYMYSLGFYIWNFLS